MLLELESEPLNSSTSGWSQSSPVNSPEYRSMTFFARKRRHLVAPDMLKDVPPPR